MAGDTFEDYVSASPGSLPHQDALVHICQTASDLGLLEQIINTISLIDFRPRTGVAHNYLTWNTYDYSEPGIDFSILMSEKPGVNPRILIKKQVEMKYYARIDSLVSVFCHAIEETWLAILTRNHIH